MSAPLHPATLAAHLKGAGFLLAKREPYGAYRNSGFGLQVEGNGGIILRFIEARFYKKKPANHRAELERMIAALAPDFEVAEDLGSRVVVRRAMKP